MFYLKSGEIDWFGIINFGGAFLLLIIGFSLIFYKMYKDDKKFEEEMKQLFLKLHALNKGKRGVSSVNTLRGR